MREKRTSPAVWLWLATAAVSARLLLSHVCSASKSYSSMPSENWKNMSGIAAEFRLGVRFISSSGDQVSESILFVTFASLLYWTLPQILNYML
jgi:hypothetical protein